MIFSYLSAHVDPNSTSRIAVQNITGIWIDSKKRRNQESYKFDYSSKYMFSCSDGMAFGFSLFFIGIVAGFCNICCSHS
jgi:hypothetical protein